MRRRLCVVHSPVMVLQRNVEHLAERIQRVLVLVWQKHAGNHHGIHIGIIRGKSLPCSIFPDKAHIKGSIVRHHHRSFTKSKKLRQHLLNLRRFHHHGVIYACKLFNFKGNRHLGIDKSGISVQNLSVPHLYRPNFNDTVMNRRKTRGFYVKYHIGLIQILPFVSGHNLLQIVHDIRFHAVDYLKEILLVRFFPLLLSFCLFFLPQVLPDMICIRKSLYHAVIRNGNRRMPPLVGALDNVLCLRNPVHIAHLGVTVQFHSLFHGSIHPAHSKIRDFFDACNGADSQLMVEFVHHGDAFYFYKASYF